MTAAERRRRRKRRTLRAIRQATAAGSAATSAVKAADGAPVSKSQRAKISRTTARAATGQISRKRATSRARDLGRQAARTYTPPDLEGLRASGSLRDAVEPDLHELVKQMDPEDRARFREVAHAGDDQGAVENLLLGDPGLIQGDAPIMGPGRSLIRAGEGVLETGTKAGNVLKAAVSKSKAAKAALAERGAVKAVGGAAKQAKSAVKSVDEATSIRGLARRGAKSTAKAAPRAAKATGRRRAAQIAGTAAKGTAKAATFPIRRPVKMAKYSLAAQAPAAIAAGDPGEFGKAFTGDGVVANVLGDAGEAVGGVLPGVAGNAAKDALDLAANAPAALYLPAAAGYEALVKDDSSRLEGLWKDYTETGIIPQALQGDWAGVAEQAKEHPLIAALEASGLKAGVGRGAGIAMRHSGSERLRGIASTEREPLRARGNLAPKPRQYSGDVINKGLQKAADRRRERKMGAQKMTPAEVAKYAEELGDRTVAQVEGVRRKEREAIRQEAHNALRLGRFKSVGGRDRNGGVRAGVEGTIRPGEHRAADLENYGNILDREHAQMKAERDGLPSSDPRRVELGRMLKANRETRAVVENLKTSPNADAALAIGQSLAQVGRRLDAEQERLGVAPAEQLNQARAIPAAAVHLGAEYGIANETRANIARLESILSKTNDPAKRHSLQQKIDELHGFKQLLDENGNAMPDAERRLAERGIEPGFVSQSPNARSRGDFYQPANRDAALPKGRARTTAATLKGTADQSIDAVIDQLIRSQGRVSQAKGYTYLQDQIVVSRPGQHFDSRAEAQRAIEAAADDPAYARAHGIPTDIPLVPMKRSPRLVKDDGSSQNAAGEETILEQLHSHALKDDDAGEWVLASADGANRLKEHFRGATQGRKLAQLYSSAFKGTVLPTSLGWILGNGVDTNIRTLLAAHSTPWGVNAKFGRKILDDLEKQDPDAAAYLRAIVAPGGHFSLAGRGVYRDASQFSGKVGRLMNGLHKIRQTPGPKQVADGYAFYRDAVFAANERFLERQAQYAVLGKVAKQQLRKTEAGWRDALKAGGPAYEELTRGLLKTENQIKYAKEVEKVLGQWTSNSPNMRGLLVDYAPFAMWVRASTKFVGWTLPVHHPIKTAIAAAAYEMTQKEREALGLSYFTDGALPPGLQGSLPGGKVGLIPVQKLTSFGTFADPTKAIADMVLPQAPVSELSGLDWSGKKLAHEDGTPLNPLEMAGVAVKSQAEALIPFLSYATRVSEDDESGSVGGAVARALLPSVTRPYDEQMQGYLRSLSGSKQITVPAHPSGSPSSSSSSSSDSSVPWSSSSSSSSGSPWSSSSSSSGGSAPWQGG